MNKSLNASQFPIEYLLESLKFLVIFCFSPSFLMFLIFLFTAAWYRQSDVFVELDKHFVSIVSAMPSMQLLVISDRLIKINLSGKKYECIILNR